MIRHAAILTVIIGIVLNLVPVPAFAQTPEPAQQTMAELIRHGYDVVAVGYYTDDQGKQDPNGVYVQMETIVDDPEIVRDNPLLEYLVQQIFLGYTALSRYYPQVTTLYAILRYDHYLFIYKTSVQDWDDFNDNQISGQDFVFALNRNALIYDVNARKYVGAKDFVNQQHTAKNQQNKNFTGLAKPPLPPANTDPNARAENIWFDASTTYLPADGTTSAVLMANLRDRNYAALTGRDVFFAFEAQGQPEARLGTRTTDAFGTARTNIKSSRALNRVLLRAGTPDYTASSQIVIGAPPGKDADARARTVVTGLTNIGYSDVDADVVAGGGAIAQARVASNQFDQKVYSQLVRIIGTLRTVYPDVDTLMPALIWNAPDGHTYTMLWIARPDYWDAFVAGAIGENQLWQSMAYRGTLDERGQWVSDRDFVYKNFGASSKQSETELRVTIQATLSQEEWGPQLNVASFAVSAGGVADSFSVAEMGGNVEGFAIYAAPDFVNPAFTYKQGDDPGALSALRLEQGQYVLDLIGGDPPATVTLNYVEHLAR